MCVIVRIVCFLFFFFKRTVFDAKKKEIKIFHLDFVVVKNLRKGEKSSLRVMRFDGNLNANFEEDPIRWKTL